MKIIKTRLYPTYRGGGSRLECWEAKSDDNVWRFERIEDTGTPWRIVHVPTGIDCGLANSLPKAVKAIETGLVKIPTAVNA